MLCAHPLFAHIKSFYLVGCSVARPPTPGRSGGRRGRDSSTSRTISDVGEQNHLCPARRPLPAALCLGKLPVLPCHTLSASDPSPSLVASAVSPSLLLPFTFTRHQRALSITFDQRCVTTPTNRQIKMNNMYLDIAIILIMSGIETNPGPHDTNIQYPRNLRTCHINVNSITSPGRLDELSQFVETHSIDILALTETKLDEHVHESLYKLDNFHQPFTRHRNRHGGGVALYTRTNLPTTRLHQLETGEEEWIWTKTKVDDNVILTCCLYLPPNLSSERLERFIDTFTDSVSLAQAYSPTTIIITGDFNTGNIFLPDDTRNHSGVTAFDIKLYDAIYSLNLTQVISTPTRLTESTANLRDLIITSTQL